jgi:hypothetical protein
VEKYISGATTTTMGIAAMLIMEPIALAPCVF